MASNKVTRIPILPTTRLGWWAVAFSGVAAVWALTWLIVPFGALFGFAAGSLGGVLALTAILRDNDRSLCAYAALIPMLFVLWFLLAQVLSGIGPTPAH